MHANHPQRIAVLLDTSVSYGSQIACGVAHYAREQPSWQLLMKHWGALEQRVPRAWHVDGVITRVIHRKQAVALRRLNVPVVNVSRSVVPGFRFPQVVIDERQVGSLAAGHLLDRGFRSLAYCCATDQPNYTDQMEPAFQAALRGSGATCAAFSAWRRKPARRATTPAELQRWLQTLAKPVGILAWDVEIAHHLREACLPGGFRIPEDVAIVSAEDDDLICRASYPPLSAVDCGSERVGYEAAAWVARCLAGQRATGESMLIAPVGIIARHSTDILAIEDQELTQALRFLRDHAYGPLQMRDVLRHVPLSRRDLDQRFLRLLGRSPAAELRRLRLAKAQDLLTNTNWPMPKIASASGFSQTEVMNRVFRRELRQTPTHYRRTTQNKSPGSLQPTR